MQGIIDNIINSYDTQAEALGVLVANTQKAIDQSGKEGNADEQVQKVENFVRNLVMNLNNMLTKFYFLKDRKSRKQEQMTDRQVKATTEFVIFVRTLSENVRSLLRRFRESQTFEEKIDEEIGELETCVGQKLKEFDKALDETDGTLTIHPIKVTRNIAGSFVKQLGNLFDRPRGKTGKSDEKRSESLMYLKG
ncbi:hypothetical protein KKH65_02625 [bacterium]|nr:hypothetical protein [Planctomycetota bacterium]MBU1517984.1 hypothetical protein [Planctomycetota bacterium]MBU2461752.1 hypothetical protein [bacterium]